MWLFGWVGIVVGVMGGCLWGFGGVGVGVGSGWVWAVGSWGNGWGCVRLACWGGCLHLVLA